MKQVSDTSHDAPPGAPPDERIVARRLFVPAPLTAGQAVPLDAAQAHYLRHVLRLQPGAELPVFNGVDGEWLVRLVDLGKNRGSALPLRALRPQDSIAGPWLMFAPLKHDAIDYLVEKATELGVARLLPVRTERTNVARIRLDRLNAHAREAAEQTERLSVPAIDELQPLDHALRNWPRERHLILCDESGTAPPLASMLANTDIGDAEWAFLIGPEGGFTEEEFTRIRSHPFVTPVGLGPRVLRADTAALSALAVFQALKGDWTRDRTDPKHRNLAAAGA